MRRRFGSWDGCMREVIDDDDDDDDDDGAVAGWLREQ